MENEVKENTESKKEQVLNTNQITTSPKTPFLTMPMAIVLAGLLIGGGLYFSSIQKAKIAANAQNNQGGQQQGDLESINKVTKDDHIRGNLNAAVTIVTYSDAECPFCKVFHNTMSQIMAEHEAKGDVAWVYRHFPIDSLHPNARKEAESMECANEQGGNDAFWKYTDKLYEITPSNNRLDLKELPKIAAMVGLDVAKFNECLVSGKYLEHIARDEANAKETGGQGTPWSVVIGKNGKKYPLSGAQSVSSVNQLINLAANSK